MGNLTHTVSGDIASFRSAARVPIESLKCHFLPKQDLHGYSNPWPAGGGENIWDEEWELGTFDTTTGEDIVLNKQIRAKNLIPISANTTYYFKSVEFVWILFYDQNKNVIENYYLSNTISTSGNASTIKNTTFFTPVNGAYMRFYLLSGYGTTYNNDISINKTSTNTSYSPYENICPIEGWNSCNIYKTSKNIGHIIGFSASAQDARNRILTNTYGTTIDTINFNGPNGAVTITQSQSPQTSNVPHYQNGYIDFYPDNLVWDQKYNISFKISNITANPLNTTINNFKLINPFGSQYGPSKVEENIVYYNNVIYKQRADRPEITCFDIRICGISCTISDFIITSADIENDGIWEPYYGDIIPVTFPIIGKNKFNWNVEFVNPDITTSTSASKRIFQPYTYCVGGSYSNYFMPIAVESYNIENGIISVKRKTGYSVYGVSYALPLISGQTYYLSCTAVSGFIHTAFYDEEGNYLTGSSNNYSNFSFIVPDNATISVFNFIPSNTTDTATFSNIQIELGNTATEYTEFSDNNTVYGGYVDVVKGLLIAEWICKKALWKDIKNNNPDSITNIDSGYIYFDNPIIYATTGANAENSFCNVGRYAWAGKDYSVPHFYPGSRGGRTCSEIYLPSNTNDEIEIQTVVKLLNPIHHPLSKTELKTFLDQNNIWSNTNDITEVSYQIHDSNMIQRAKKNMIAENQTHYRKVLWNQMAGPMNSSYWGIYNSNYISASFTDDYAEITIIDTAVNSYSTAIYTSNEPKVNIDHIYYVSYLVQPNFSGGKFNSEFGGGAIGGGMDATIDEWTRYSARHKGSRTGSGRLYLPNFIPNTYSIGDKAKVKSAIYIDLTAMFGKGNEPTKLEFEYMCSLNNIDLTSDYPIDNGTEKFWCIPNSDTNKYTIVNWNQLLPELKASNWEAYNSSYANVTFSNNTATRTVLQDASSTWTASVRTKTTINTDTTHKYYIKQELNSSVAKRYVVTVGGQWAKSFTIDANTWTICETLGIPLQSEKMYIIYDTDNSLSKTGDSCSVRKPLLIDLTLMFGAGNEPSTVDEFHARCLKNDINLDTIDTYTTNLPMIWKL